MFTVAGFPGAILASLDEHHVTAGARWSRALSGGLTRMQREPPQSRLPRKSPGNFRMSGLKSSASVAATSAKEPARTM